MKKCLLIGLLISCLSCTKSVTNTATPKDTPGLIQAVNTAVDSTYFTRDLGSTTLTINMNPVLTCYSSNVGETPKPCNIFIDIVCHLSNPINAFVKVEIEKRDVVEQTQNAGYVADVKTVVLMIAPNTTKITFPSTFTNKNNQDVPDTQYKIVNASVFQTVN